MNFSKIVISGLLMATIAGCSDGPTSLDPSVLENLELRVILSAPSVEIGSTFEVTIQAENTSSVSKTFQSTNSCFVIPVVVDEEGERHNGFSGVACLSDSQVFDIEPGSTVEFAFTIQTQTMFATPPPGEYAVEARFQVQPELPTIRETIEVTT